MKIQCAEDADPNAEDCMGCRPLTFALANDAEQLVRIGLGSWEGALVALELVLVERRTFFLGCFLELNLSNQVETGSKSVRIKPFH